MSVSFYRVVRLQIKASQRRRSFLPEFPLFCKKRIIRLIGRFDFNNFEIEPQMYFYLVLLLLQTRVFRQLSRDFK